MTEQLAPFAQRPPSVKEFERFRLILSTFQDGSGMLAVSGGGTKPGWRDFERAFAFAFGGIPQENKGLFDVLLPDPKRRGIFFGASCKMRGTLDQAAKPGGRASLELSNAAGEFWDALRAVGIDASNYLTDPKQTGSVLLALLEEWRVSEGLARGGQIDLSGSFYYALQWSPKNGTYQLFQFSMEIPPASTLRWYAPPSRVREGTERLARSIRADDGSGLLIEWYGESGGQLKYYPLVKDAIWASDPFMMEPLPEELPHVVLAKARDYFPAKWARTERA